MPRISRNVNGFKDVNHLESDEHRDLKIADLMKQVVKSFLECYI